MTKSELRKILQGVWPRDCGYTHHLIVNARSAITFLDASDNVRFSLDSLAFKAESIVSELLGLGEEYLDDSQFEALNDLRKDMLEFLNE